MEKEISIQRRKTYDMVYIAFFTVLIAICSWISIPAVIPFTLQTFGVFLAVSVLGGKRGTLAVIVYILLGAVGIPVFFRVCRRHRCYYGQHGRLYCRFYFFGAYYVADGALSGQESLGSGAVDGGGSDRVLCFRHSVVHVCVHR